jgi:tyrosyl-tRNA synthetase
MTSPYAFYQFWVNTLDADVVDRLKVFTFLSRERIEELGRATESEPYKRAAQRTLAYEVTRLVHGTQATEAVIAATEALFGQGELHGLDAPTLQAALRELPNTTTGENASVTQLLVDTGLTSSLSEARRAIVQGGVYLNNAKVTDETATIAGAILPAGVAVLRRGKKTLAGVFVE